MDVRLITIGGLLIYDACNQTGAGGPFWEMFTGGRTVDRIPLNWLELCQHTIAAPARPHGATLVEAAGVDIPRRLANGLTEAIINATITRGSWAGSRGRHGRRPGAGCEEGGTYRTC